MAVRARGIRVRRVPARGALIRPMSVAAPRAPAVQHPRLLRLLRGRAPGGQTKHPRPQARRPPCRPAVGRPCPPAVGRPFPPVVGRPCPPVVGSTVPGRWWGGVHGAGRRRWCGVVLSPAAWRARARRARGLVGLRQLHRFTRGAAPGWNPVVWTPESCRCSIPYSPTTRSAFPTSRSSAHPSTSNPSTSSPSTGNPSAPTTSPPATSSPKSPPWTPPPALTKSAPHGPSNPPDSPPAPPPPTDCTSPSNARPRRRWWWCCWWWWGVVGGGFRWGWWFFGGGRVGCCWWWWGVGGGWVARGGFYFWWR